MPVGLSGSVQKAPSRFPTRWNSYTNESYLTKYNAQNQILWTIKTHTGIIRRSTVDTSNNVYIVGINPVSTNIQLDYNGGEIYNADGTFASNLRFQLFVAKISPVGKVQWVAGVYQPAGWNTTDPIGLAVANLGGAPQVYVTFKNLGATIRFFSSTGTQFGNLTNIGSTDGFIVRFDGNGIVQYIAKQGSTAADLNQDVTIDSNHEIIISGTGVATSAANYVAYTNSQTIGVSLTSTNTSSTDVMLVKYISDLTPQWITHIGTAGADGSGITRTTTDSSRNIYVTGQYANGVCTSYNNGNTAFSPTLPAFTVAGVFLTKYNSSGTVQWNARMGGTGASSPFSLATDASGNSLVGGSTSGTFTAYSIGNIAFSPTLSTRTSFLVYYNTSGAVQWLLGQSGTSTYYVDITVNGSNFLVTYRCATSDTISLYTTSGNLFNTYTGVPFLVISITSTGTMTVVSPSNPLVLANAISVDATGAYFVSGPSSRTTTTASYSESLVLTKSSTGQNDGLLVKYNANGTPLWSANAGASNSIDTIYAVLTDSSNNIYATGQFGIGGSTVNVYHSSGTLFNSYTVPATATGLALLIKYDSSGTVLWVANFGVQSGRGLAKDSAENIYVTGIIAAAGSPFSFKNADGTTFLSYTIVSGTSRNAYVLKINSSGTIQWIRNLNGSASTADGIGICLDSSSNVYATGSFTGSYMNIWNTPGGTLNTTLTNGGSSCAYVIKYDSSGTYLAKARLAGSGSGSEFGYSILCDLNNNLYVTGSSDGGSTVTAYNFDGTAFATTLGNSRIALFCKWNSAGTVQFLLQFTNTAVPSPVAYGLAADATGLYIAVTAGTSGVSNNTIFTGTGGYNITIPTSSTQDAFLVKYTFAGSPLWARRITGSTSGSVDSGYGVSLDKRGNAFLAITMNNPSGGSTSSGVDTSTQASFPIPYSACIVKYDTNGTAHWVPRLQGSTTFASGFCTSADLDGNVLLGGRTAGSASVTETTNLYRNVYTNLLA